MFFRNSLCIQTTLVDLILWVLGGFGGIFGFVEMSALELLVDPSYWLKMLGMYILPIL